MASKLYDCTKVTLQPPKDFVPCNSSLGYKDSITIDACLSSEILFLWDIGIRTRGCCCGHGAHLGFIQVVDEDIPRMYELGYTQYIYDDKFGGIDRKDAFVPKSYGHVYNGYADSHQG